MKKMLILAIAILIACSETKANHETGSEIANDQMVQADETSKEIIPGLSNHWVQIKYFKDESVIFVPCDFQNTEFIIKKENGKTLIDVIEGQDGLSLNVLSTTKINEKTTRIKVEFSTIKFSYYVQKLEDGSAIWTKPEMYECETCRWENKDLDDLTYLEQKSIRTVAKEKTSSYKTVKAPPCTN